MPRSMADPNYVRRYLSPEQRAAMSAAHRKRLGIQEDHHRLWGVDVPDEMLEAMRLRVSFAARRGATKAQCAFLVRLLMALPELMDGE